MRLLKCLCIVLIFATIGCERRSPSQSNSGNIATKKIVAKENPIENRVSGVEILFGSGSITKSETIYYLIADDGTSVQTDMGTWTKFKIGDSLTSSAWRRK